MHGARILLVEDNPGDADYIQEVLSACGHVRFQVETVARLSAALTRLGKLGIDLVLLDLGLPDSQGIATFQKIRHEVPDVPVIVLTGTDDEELGVAAVREGAQDFLVKGVHNGKLQTRMIRHALERIQAQNELGKSQRLLAEVSKIGKVGGWEINIETGKQLWTEETYHIHEVDPGYEPTIELGINFYTPSSRPVIARVVQRAIELGEPFDVELEILTAKGNLRSVRAIGKADPGHHRVYGFFQDITERKQAESTLHDAVNWLTKSQEVAGFGCYVLDITTGMWSSTDVMNDIFGINADYERTVDGWVNLVHPGDRAMMIDYFRNEVLGKKGLFNKQYRILRHLDQTEGWVHGHGRLEFDALGQPLRMIGIIQDITTRKQREVYHELERVTLNIFNESNDVLNSLQRVIAEIKTLAGVDAVGIRLLDKEDFPYFVQHGFPDDFLAVENSLFERDANGLPCRDCDGKVRLECLCGLVATGKPAPPELALTPGGSFWTNNLLPLLDLESSHEPRPHLRNRCLLLGCASMALVPIRTKTQIIGLLQLNAYRQHCFSSVAIEQLESITAHIGEALIRKQAEAALQVAVRQQEALLMEVHHRVKNNLQIISSLLRMQSDKLDNAVAKSAMTDMQSRVRSMALIHESLYHSDNFAAVDLSVYLKSLCQQLFRMMAGTPADIRLHLALTPVHLAIDQAVPCGLLVNELVTNTLKHAFPDGRDGELRVELDVLDEPSSWRLRVADNGIGLPPDFKIENLSSLGLKLVSDLTRQLGAKLRIGPGPGATFEIEVVNRATRA